MTTKNPYMPPMMTLDAVEYPGIGKHYRLSLHLGDTIVILGPKLRTLAAGRRHANMVAEALRASIDWTMTDGKP